MFEITEWRVTPLSLPLREPFAVAARTAYEARNVLLRLAASAPGGGTITGLGAGVPVQYVTGESVESVTAALQAAATALVGAPTLRLAPLLDRAAALLPDAPTARAALEMACLDLWARRWRLPLWHWYGGALDALTADLTIPIVAPDAAGDKASAAWARGFRQLKIKVGDPQGIDADYDRLAAVAAAAPGAALRIDANQAFEPDAAVEFVRRAARIAPGIEIVEQPVPKEDFRGLRAVREGIGRALGGGAVRPPLLFADESAQSEASVASLIESRAVDGVNVKIMKSGLVGAWRIAALCRAHGVGLMVGCMLESPLPLTAACALVAGTGWFDYVDLDSHHLLAPTTLFDGGFENPGGGPILRPEAGGAGWGVSLRAPEGNIGAADPVGLGRISAGSGTINETGDETS